MYLMNLSFWRFDHKHNYILEIFKETHKKHIYVFYLFKKVEKFYVCVSHAFDFVKLLKLKDRYAPENF